MTKVVFTRGWALVSMLLCVVSLLCVVACGGNSPRAVGDASTDTGQAAADASTSDASSDCTAGGPGCTCTTAGASCEHSLGGIYGDRACSGGFQCCDGSFEEGLDVCGPCVCSESTGETGCSGGDEICFPAFTFEVLAISSELQEEMTGVSWHPELACPPFDELRLVRLSHWRFDGTLGTGELVLASSVTAEVISVFEGLYEARFPVERIERIDLYGGDDNASLAVNNTSAFNCRRVTGGSSLSQHSFGTAIDINPRQNPYVSGQTILPPEGAEYLDRADFRPGMIIDGDVTVEGFSDIGWGWGGNFNSIKDYQHFSESGR